MPFQGQRAGGPDQDRGGPALSNYLDEVLVSAWEAVIRVIPDDLETLKATLIELCDSLGCCLVVTTGGTGPRRAGTISPRPHRASSLTTDVTGARTGAATVVIDGRTVVKGGLRFGRAAVRKRKRQHGEGEHGNGQGMQSSLHGLED